VVGQDRDERLLHLRLQQAIDRARRQLLEGGIGRRKDRKRAGRLQRVDQSRGLHGGDKGGVILRVHRVLDDVLRGIHWSAADGDGLLLHLRVRRGRRPGSKDERRDGNRRRQDRGSHVVFLHVLVCAAPAAWGFRDQR